MVAEEMGQMATRKISEILKFPSTIRNQLNYRNFLNPEMYRTHSFGLLQMTDHYLNCLLKYSFRTFTICISNKKKKKKVKGSS